MKSSWVYILKCSDGSYYTGCTSNIQKRLLEHQSGIFRCYTSTRLPIELIFSQEFTDIDDAIRAERRIKGWTRKKKDALIAGKYDLLHELSQCRNLSHSQNKTSAP